MSREALEDKLVQKTLSILRMARQVIDKLHDDKEEGFQEDPSLSDLVLVAQILGQTSMFDRLGEVGLPEGAELPTEGCQVVAGPIAMPDILVMWTPEGWYVNLHPELQQQPRLCGNPEELSSVLQQMAVVCGEHRRP